MARRWSCSFLRRRAAHRTQTMMTISPGPASPAHHHARQDLPRRSSYQQAGDERRTRASSRDSALPPSDNEEKNQFRLTTGSHSYIEPMCLPFTPRVLPPRCPGRHRRPTRSLPAAMTRAEVARHEGTSEDEIFWLLEERIRQSGRLSPRRGAARGRARAAVDRLRATGLQHLADMDDTKALFFLTYEGNRGRHPENRLRRLTLPRPADLPPRFRFFEIS